jgi:hypothetical protein
MANEKKKSITEDDLLKALGDLEAHADEYEDDEVEKAASEDDSEDESEDESEEDEAKKSHTKATPGMPGDTKEANGGFGEEPSAEGAEEFDVSADEDDPTGASMKSLVGDSDTLRKGFEISPFLEALTDATTTSVDRLAKSQIDFQNETREFNARLQKAVIAIGNKLLSLEKSQSEALEQPVVARPRSVVRKSDVAERFEQEQDAPRFDKAQTLEALTELAIKGEVPSLVVSAYEGSGFVDPAYMQVVNSKLQSMYGR